MKNFSASTLILLLFLLAGFAILLYPIVSNYWNSLHQSRAIAAYDQQVALLDERDYAPYLTAAEEYNRHLALRPAFVRLTPEEEARYRAVLNPGGNGMMGYVEIPAINCLLPICHGTDESVLQKAVGHTEWSNLPIGGAGTHCVLSGHCGLPGARLFTDLDKLALGDTFLLHVLGRTLTYEVDRILVVLPDETDALQTEPEQDYCTLLTCTPYGINSHRLLVRGHRVETSTPDTGDPPAEGTETAPSAARIIAIAVLLFFFLIILLIWLPKRQPIPGGDHRKNPRNVAQNASVPPDDDLLCAGKHRSD